MSFGPRIWARELRHAARVSSVALLGRSRASGDRNPSPMHHYYSPLWAGQSAHPSQVWCSLSRSLGSSVPFSPSLIPHRRPEPRTWRAPASLLLWSARAPPLACSREEESAWEHQQGWVGLELRPIGSGAPLWAGDSSSRLVIVVMPRLNVTPCSHTAILGKFYLQRFVVILGSRRSSRIGGFVPDATDWVPSGGFPPS